jgi:hypothetical protein
VTLRFAALALGLAILAHGGGAGAAGPIYKCAGANAAPLYTDLPCKGGTILDIRPGGPDPAAIERLARLQARYDALALAEAAHSYADEQAYAPGSSGDFGRYDDQAGAAADDVAYSPIDYSAIYVSYRPFFRHRSFVHPGKGQRHRLEPIEPRRFDSARAMTGGFRSRPASVPRGQMPQDR